MVIYELSRPDGVPFYVGKTGNPKRRQREHRTERKDPTITLTVVRQAKGNGVLEERAQIAQLRMMGYRLENQNRGGGGSRVGAYSHGPEQLRKMSEAMMGNTYGVGNRSRTGMTPSEDTRSKMSAAQTGRVHSPDDIRKSADARRGGTTSLKGVAWSPKRRAACVPRLTDGQVAELRSRHVKGTTRRDRGNTIELCREFGISKTTLLKITSIDADDQ